MAPSCPRCGSTEIENDGATVICTACSAVIAESTIVSEVTFAEGLNGASSVIGQFVGATGKRNFRHGGLTNHPKDSREITVENGRRKISQIAAALKLRPHHVEAAQRLFMLAVQHNFIQV